MESIQVSATFPNIAAASLAEFKDLARQAVEIARGEATTTQYDWFFNEAETLCVVRETYVNSDAVLAHLANTGALLGQLVGLGGGLEVEVFGAPSPELLAATAAFQPTIHTYHQGK